jgi:hypothetical protein
MLIAYAAKAGSVAEDGTGQHSPFAVALLKHLSVPGLDVRFAFGRVKDDVMKATGNKQEPFVYGSLGGDAISLVPAPKAPSVSDAKNTYEMVERIGTKKAWEVFLSSHKEGFYADLARAQLQKLARDEARGAPAQAAAAPQAADTSSPSMRLAAVEPARRPEPAAPSNEERRAWDRLKDSGDRTAIRKFIERYPSSVLREPAQTRLDTLERAAQEREEKARAEREAAQQREQAEREAARKRDEEARLARIAEAERRKQEREAATQREAAAQRERELATQREAAERRERELQAQREAAERREAARREKEEAERLKAEREGDQRRLAALEAERRQKDSVCARDEDRVARLRGSLSQGWARADLQRLQEHTRCERLKTEITALLSQPAPEAVTRPPPPPEPVANTPALVRAAQSELRRIGCFAGRDDGNLNNATREAIERYFAVHGRGSRDIAVTEAFVADLKDHEGRICPLTCARGQHAEGDRCVAVAKPEPEQKKKPVAKREREPEPRREARPKPERKQVERKQPERAQQSRTQAAAPARPAGGGGGGGAMIGVGF